MAKRIEINGVRFSKDEIKSVTITRAGKDIYLENVEQNDGRIKGFAPPKPAPPKVEYLRENQRPPKPPAPIIQ